MLKDCQQVIHHLSTLKKVCIPIGCSLVCDEYHWRRTGVPGVNHMFTPWSTYGPIIVRLCSMLWRNWYDCKNLALLKPSQPQLEKQYLSLAFSDIRHRRDYSVNMWFTPGTPVSSTNKIDHHYITEILLNVALITITLIPCKVNFCIL
jgi:hypothetical protein